MERSLLRPPTQKFFLFSSIDAILLPFISRQWLDLRMNTFGCQRRTRRRIARQTNQGTPAYELTKATLSRKILECLYLANGRI